MFFFHLNYLLQRCLDVDNALPESERKPYTLDIATERTYIYTTALLYLKYLRCHLALINIVGAAAQALRDGGCIALPSDTVYGLVSLRSNMTRLFDIKHRDASKPIGFFVRDPAIIEQYAETTAPTRALLHKLLPGKVTLLLKRRVMANDATLNLPPLVGFRVPDDALIRALCEHLDEPLAQTSANVSGAPSSLVCKVCTFSCIFFPLKKASFRISPSCGVNLIF